MLHLNKIIECLPEVLFSAGVCARSWSLLMVKVAAAAWLLIVGVASLRLPFSSPPPEELCWIRSWPIKKILSMTHWRFVFFHLN